MPTTKFGCFTSCSRRLTVKTTSLSSLQTRFCKLCTISTKRGSLKVGLCNSSKLFILRSSASSPGRTGSALPSRLPRGERAMSMSGLWEGTRLCPGIPRPLESHPLGWIKAELPSRSELEADGLSIQRLWEPRCLQASCFNACFLTWSPWTFIFLCIPSSIFSGSLIILVRVSV